MKTIARAQKELFIIWMVGAVLIFPWAIFRTLYDGDHNDDMNSIIDWLLSSIAPTFMVAVGGFLIQDNKVDEHEIDEFRLKLSEIFSIVYLVLIAIILGFALVPTIPDYEVIKRTNKIVPPLQGVVAASMGLFFSKPTRKRVSKRSTKDGSEGK